MTFYNEKESNIIKTFHNVGYNYKVEYLDGTESNYYCTDENKRKHLEQKMLEQAKNRDKEYYDLITKKHEINKSVIILLSSASIIGYNADITLLLCTSLVLLIISVKKYFSNMKKLKELKKYRLLLSMYDELKKPENKGISDILEIDKIYAKPFLDITTVDDYSLSDLNEINKELIKRKELKNI